MSKFVVDEPSRCDPPKMLLNRIPIGTAFQGHITVPGRITFPRAPLFMLVADVNRVEYYLIAMLTQGPSVVAVIPKDIDEYRDKEAVVTDYREVDVRFVVTSTEC